MSLFGIPFLLAGLFVMQLPFGLVPVPMENPPESLGMSLVFFGLPFVLVGGGLVFGRKGVIIDQRNRTVAAWWGLIVPMYRKTRGLDEVTAIEISEVAGDSESPDTYPVKILFGPGERPFTITGESNYQKMLRMATWLAGRLERPLADVTPAGKAGRTVSER